MAYNHKAAFAARRKAALGQARREAETAAAARVKRTEALVAPKNDATSVVATSVYNGFQEWPKWLYNRTNAQARIFDSLAEFEARVPEEDKANWSADPFEGAADGLLRSPATGGAADPALRAAAQPRARTDDGPPARLPVAEADTRERVTLRGPATRDPQRLQAAEDSNARAGKAGR